MAVDAVEATEIATIQCTCCVPFSMYTGFLVWHGMARHGLAWSGMVWHGLEWPGIRALTSNKSPGFNGTAIPKCGKQKKHTTSQNIYSVFLSPLFMYSLKEKGTQHVHWVNVPFSFVYNLNLYYYIHT